MQSKEQRIVRPSGPMADTKWLAWTLNISERKARDLCEEGVVKAVKVGRIWRVNVAATLEQFGLA